MHTKEKLSERIVQKILKFVPLLNQVDFADEIKEVAQLEQTNATLLEASELMSAWFDDDGCADSVPPRTRVFGIRRAIRKAKGE